MTFIWLAVTSCGAPPAPAGVVSQPGLHPGSGVQPIGGSAPKTSAQPPPRPRSEADVNFMSGMIPHHAQAVLIAGWAPTHGARADVQILCERIVIGQRDEISTMRRWLQDHGEVVPDSNATYSHMMMDGMAQDMLMPGMLSDAQLAQLDSARGAAFDRLFLTDMIKHHQGALTMVDALFASYGAAQDDLVFRFASDVYADQTTEVDRMQRMLAATPSGGGAP